MSRVKIATFVRCGATFVPVEGLDCYDGDPDYVAGSISLIVGEKAKSTGRRNTLSSEVFDHGHSGLE